MRANFSQTVMSLLCAGACWLLTGHGAHAQTGQVIPQFNIIRPPMLTLQPLYQAPLYASNIKPQTLNTSPLNVVPLNTQYMVTLPLAHQWLAGGVNPGLLPGAPLEPSLAEPWDGNQSNGARERRGEDFANGFGNASNAGTQSSSGASAAPTMSRASANDRRQPLGW